MYLQPHWLLVRMCVRLPYVGFRQCRPSHPDLRSTPHLKAPRRCGRERHRFVGCGMGSEQLNAGLVNDTDSPVAGSGPYHSPHPIWAMLAASSQQGGHRTLSHCLRRPRARSRMLPFGDLHRVPLMQTTPPGHPTVEPRAVVLEAHRVTRPEAMRSRDIKAPGRPAKDKSNSPMLRRCRAVRAR